MRCPYCGHADTKVTDSRESDDGIRRRRECLSRDCGRRFTTYERVQAAPLMVVKKDGRREEFSREKVLAGIRRSCAKLPISAAQISAVVDDIEATLQARPSAGSGQAGAEVASDEIGEMVMERLQELDHVAYVRFASHYRSFLSLEDLQQELERLTLAPASRRSSRQGVAAQPPLLPPTELNRLAGQAGLDSDTAPPVPLEERRARRRAAR